MSATRLAQCMAAACRAYPLAWSTRTRGPQPCDTPPAAPLGPGLQAAAAGGRGRGRGGGGRGGYFQHDDRGDDGYGAAGDAGQEDVFEAGDPANYSGGNNITVRISATHRGPREVSDTTGALPRAASTGDLLAPAQGWSAGPGAARARGTGGLASGPPAAAPGSAERGCHPAAACRLTWLQPALCLPLAPPPPPIGACPAPCPSRAGGKSQLLVSVNSGGGGKGDKRVVVVSGALQLLAASGVQHTPPGCSFLRAGQQGLALRLRWAGPARRWPALRTTTTTTTT